MQAAAAFVRDERGSYTIEFCLWIPVFLFFLAATIDASMLYLTHNAMWNAARDTARRVTTGELPTEQSAKDYLATQVTVYRDEMNPPRVVKNDEEVTVSVSVPIREVSPFGIFGWTNYWYGYQGKADFNSGDLVATVAMRVESR